VHQYQDIRVIALRVAPSLVALFVPRTDLWGDKPRQKSTGDAHTCPTEQTRPGLRDEAATATVCGLHNRGNNLPDPSAI
jgi:hypothetical protein